MTKNKRDRRVPSTIHSHTRRAESFERLVGVREPQKCLLIVCEGSKTEPSYFKELRKEYKLQRVEVEIEEGSGGAALSIVNLALKIKLEREIRIRERKKGNPSLLPFDEVWCVFDTENLLLESTSFYQAVTKAYSNGLKLAVSNPAFEFWYLLHFSLTDKPFSDANNLIKELKKYINDYEKSMNVCGKYGLLKLTEYAIQRARNLDRNHPETGKEFPNPSTSVYRLVETLSSMSVSYRYG